MAIADTHTNGSLLRHNSTTTHAALQPLDPAAALMAALSQEQIDELQARGTLTLDTRDLLYLVRTVMDQWMS